MTKNEAERLKKFIKEHGKGERNSHTYLIKQDGQFVSCPYINGHVRVSTLIKESSYLGIEFKDIKSVSLWISTTYGTFYF